LAAHDFEEGGQIDWNQRGILQSESNTIYRKYREATHNPINQSDVDITPMWLPLIKKELERVYNVRLDIDYYWMFELCMFLYLTNREC